MNDTNKKISAALIKSNSGKNSGTGRKLPLLQLPGMPNISGKNAKV